MTFDPGTNALGQDILGRARERVKYQHLFVHSIVCRNTGLFAYFHTRKRMGENGISY